ncbi:MAG: hypothetical protein ACK4ZD_02680 [Caldimonas sp.]|jgi:hypothetical protein
MDEQDFDEQLADTRGEVFALWAGAVGLVLVAVLGLVLIGLQTLG